MTSVRGKLPNAEDSVLPPCLHKTINNARTFSWLAPDLAEAMLCTEHLQTYQMFTSFTVLLVTHKLHAACFPRHLTSHNIVNFQKARRKFSSCTIHPSFFLPVRKLPARDDVTTQEHKTI